MNVVKHILKMLTIVLAVISTFSCSQDDFDLGNLDETLFVRHENADMPAYIKGNGSEKIFLITLHGGPGGLGLGFRGEAFDQIEEKYAVVYFDQRGSGMSQGSFSEDEVTIDLMAEDVLALTKVIKHKYGSDVRFYLLGLSWGGTLGPATLLKDQDDFLGWINVDGAHNLQDIYFEYIAHFERVAASQITLGNSVDFWEDVIDVLDIIDRDTFNRDDAYRLNSKAGDAESMLEDDGFISPLEEGESNLLEYNVLTIIWNINNIQSILDEDTLGVLSYTDSLSEITIPSLVLWGRYDMIVPPRFAQEAFDNLGGDVKELVFFENSGHTPMFSEPDLFAQEVLAFMEENK